MLMCIKLTVMSQLPQAKLVSSFFSCNYGNNNNKILNNAKEKLIQCRQKKERETWKTPSRGKCAFNLSCLPFPANSEKKTWSVKMNFLFAEREREMRNDENNAKDANMSIKSLSFSQVHSESHAQVTVLPLFSNIATFQKECAFL